MLSLLAPSWRSNATRQTHIRHRFTATTGKQAMRNTPAMPAQQDGGIALPAVICGRPGQAMESAHICSRNRCGLRWPPAAVRGHMARCMHSQPDNAHPRMDAHRERQTCPRGQACRTSLKPPCACTALRSDGKPQRSAGNGHACACCIPPHTHRRFLHRADTPAWRTRCPAPPCQP